MIFPVRLGGFYVSFLRALVSADQQQQHLIAIMGIVHTVAGAVGDPQLHDAGANSLVISKIANRNPVKPGGTVAQGEKPFPERLFSVLIGVVGKLARSGLHGLIVSYTIRSINRKDNRTFAE